MNATTDGARRLITEEIPVASSELLARVKSLLEEGRVRHIKVKSPSGEVYFEVPLALGVIGGAALAWASPWLAMASALAGLVTNVKLEVAREPTDADAVEENRKAADEEWRAVTAKRKGSRAVAAAKGTAKPATAATKRAARTAKTQPKVTRPTAAKKLRPAAGKTAARGRTGKSTGRR